MPSAEDIYPKIDQIERKYNAYFEEKLSNIFSQVSASFILREVFKSFISKQQSVVDLVEELIGLYEGLLSFEEILETHYQYLVEAYREGIVSTIPELNNVTLQINAPDFEFLRVMHEDAPEVFHRFFDELGDKIRMVFITGFSQGWDWLKIRRELVKVFGFSIDRADKIVRTELARAAITARYRSHVESGVVPYLQWYAELDDAHCSTLPTCQQLHGELFTIEDAQGLIPRHVRCRCCWMPIIQKVKDLEIQPAVALKETYIDGMPVEIREGL